jgi:hypothetical protein
MAAAGAAALATTVVAMRTGPLALQDAAQPWMAAALALCGLALLAAACVTRDDRRPNLVPKVVAGIGVVAAAAWLLVLLWGGDVVRIHRAARQWPSATIVTCALGAALIFDRRRAFRWAALPAAVLGVFLGAAGSPAFVDWLGNDPFLARSPPIAVRTVDVEPLAEFTIQMDVSDIRLSPSARFVAVFTEDERDERRRLHAGPWGGPLADIAGDDAEFVDESRLLVLERRGEESVVRLLALDGGVVEVWSRTLPVAWARFRVEEGARRWRLIGRNGGSAILSASAGFDGSSASQEEWVSPGAFPVVGIAVSGGDLLALETRLLGNWGRALPRWAWAFGPSQRAEFALWTLREGTRSLVATSRLDLSCEGVGIDDEHTLCTAYDGTRTRFFSVGPRGQPAPLAEVAGRFFLEQSSGQGWVSGWWDYSAAVVRPATGEAIRLAHTDDMSFVFQLTVIGDVLGALLSEGDRTSIRLYPLADAARVANR